MTNDKSSELITFLQSNCILLNDNDVIDNGNQKYYKLIYKKSDSKKVKKALLSLGFKESAFPWGFVDGFAFIYKSVPPFIFIKDGIVIELWNQLCCKSFYQKVWLPLDKAIVDNIWDNVLTRDNWIVLNAEFKMLYVLTHSIYTKKQISESDIIFIKNNKRVFSSPSFMKLLEKEFFNYSSCLVSSLLNDDFEAAILNLNSFKAY